MPIYLSSNGPSPGRKSFNYGFTGPNTTKHNGSARFQYNVTGRVSMWAYDMLSQ